MSNAIQLFTQSGNVSFVDAKNNGHELSTEAALFKGGAAMAALKDMALDLALSKAVNGKYRAAAEIFMVAFPGQHKAYTKLFKAQPWANKAEFGSYLLAMEQAAPGKSGDFNKKQQAARALMSACRSIPAFVKASVEGDVIEA